MSDASIDGNSRATITGVDSSDGKTPVRIYANATTHRLLVDTAANPAGNNTEVQYNNNGNFGSNSGLTYDANNQQLTVVGGVITDLIISEGAGLDDFTIQSASVNFRNSTSLARGFVATTSLTDDRTFTLPDQDGVFSTVTSGTGVPATTPSGLGQIYIRTSNAKVYISTGTSSSADWTIVN